MSKSSRIGRRRSWRYLRNGGVLLGAIVACGFGVKAATTGWNRTAGSFVYSDAANWVSGNVNNLFDSSLTLTGSLQIEIPQTYATTGNLVFNHLQGQAGNDITLNGAGGTPSALTLAGNVQYTPQLVATGSLPMLTFGGNTNVDLGGATRTFNVGLGARVVVANGLQNGALIKSNPGELVLNGTTNLTSIVLQDVGILTSNGTIAGPGSLSVSGALATLNLLHANTYQGGTTLANATVNFSDKAAFGTGPVAITERTFLNSTAGASLTGANAITNAITLSYPGNRYLSLTPQAPVEFSGTVDLGASFTRRINAYKTAGGASFTTSFTGEIKGAGSSVIWGGNAPVYLSGASTYTGTTTIAGSVDLGASALPNVPGPFGNASSDVALDISFLQASGDTVANVAVLNLRPGVTMGRSMTVVGGTIASSGGETFVTGALNLSQYVNINVGAGGLMHFSGGATSGGGFPGQYPVTFNGPGTAVLTAGSLFTVAPVTINGGEVLYNASQFAFGGPKMPVTVNTGELGGNATFVGLLTVGNGSGTADATLSPGDGIGSMQAAAVTFKSDGVYDFELNSTTSTFDLLSANGAVQLGDAMLVVDDLGTSTLPIGFQFAILKNTSSNSTTGTFLGLPDGAGFQAGANYYTVDYDVILDGDGQANDVVLKVAVVPEPASMALLALGAVALGASRRRRA